MSRELYINDRILELDDSTVIVLSYQCNDIAEMEDRQANYSNRFKVPATNNNRKNLGFSDRVNTFSMLPYRKLKCNYFQNGIQLIKNGVLIIDAYDGDKFDVTIYSGIYDFFTQIGEKTLKDIDFSSLNFAYTNLNVRNYSRDYMLGTGNVCFPVIDWGVLPYGNWIDVRYQQPCIRFSYIMQRIFELTDYSYSGQITTDGIFSDMALTISPDEQYGSDADLLAKSFKSTISNLINSYSGDPNTVKPKRLNLLYYFNNYVLEGSLFENTEGLIILDNVNPAMVSKPLSPTDPIETLNLTRYRSKTFTTIEIDVNLYFEYGEFYRTSGTDNNGNPYIEYSVIIVKNGVFYRIIPINGDVDFTTFEFNTNLSIDVKPGDEIKVLLDCTNFTINQKFTPTGFDISKCNISFTATNTIQYGNTLNFNSIIPNLSLKEIIKSFCNMFGLIITSEYNEIIFTKFRQLSKGIPKTYIRKVKPPGSSVYIDVPYIIELPNSEDWTNKIDLSFPISVQYRIGNYGQLNNLKYSVDSNTQSFGDSSFTINDEVLQEDSTMFELLFSSALPREGIFLNKPQFKNLPISDYATTTPYSYTALYTIGDEVGFNNIIYVCIQNTPFPGIPTSFATFFQVKNNQYIYSDVVGVKIPRYTLYEADDWNSEKEYSVGDEVNYQGAIYISKTTNTNEIPAGDFTNWEGKPLQYEQTLSANNSLILIKSASVEVQDLYYWAINTSRSTADPSTPGTLTPVAYFSDAYQPYNLTFQFLIDNYYKEFINMLNRLKVVNCGIRLTESEINNIDFLKLKYIEYFGEHFYLNKVDDFNEGQTTNCQLIRI